LFLHAADALLDEGKTLHLFCFFVSKIYSVWLFNNLAVILCFVIVYLIFFMFNALCVFNSAICLMSVFIFQFVLLTG